MEQRVGARRQRQIPRMAELEVEEQAAAEADAHEDFGDDVHDLTLILRTVRHNIRTFEPYRLSYPPLTSWRGRRGVVRPTANHRNAVLPKRPPNCGRASSDTSIGTINAKSFALNRCRPLGGSSICRARPIG